MRIDVKTEYEKEYFFMYHIIGTIFMMIPITLISWVIFEVKELEEPVGLASFGLICILILISLLITRLIIHIDIIDSKKQYIEIKKETLQR